MLCRVRARAHRAAATAALALAVVASGTPDATAETLHIGTTNCYDRFDTSIVSGSVVTPGAWVVQRLSVHINWNIRNRCDPNSWVIDGTYTTGAVWEGGTHKANGGAWWMSKYNGGWHHRDIGYWAPSGIGVHEMRAYILSSISTFPSPSFYNGAARTWIEVVAPPSPPRNARTSASGVDKVLVQWDAPATDNGRAVQGYEVWRDGALIRQVGANERSIVDGPFGTPGSCRTYWVKAWNAAGVSGESNRVVGCTAPDRTAPSVVGIPSRDPDRNGWYNAPAEITWKTSDPYASSGTPTTPAPTPIDDQGNNLYTSDPSCDPAGNCAVGQYQAKLDSVAPAVTSSVTPESGPGWHNGDVTATWTCDDTTAGIETSGVETCSLPETVTDEGHHVLTGTSTDHAGNTGTATVEVDIDRTAPATAADAPSDSQPGDVTVTLSPTDALSGVATTWYRLDGGEATEGTSVPVTGHGTHSIEFWSVDVAGNVEPSRTVPVTIDAVAPTIEATVEPAANDAGWHSSAVTVTWTCDDVGSGVASCPETVVVDADGVHTVTGTVVDNVGHATTVTRTIRLDATAPTIADVPARAPDGATGWYRAAVEVEWDCDDVLSLVASCSDPVTLATEGVHTLYGSATDVAGNVTTATSRPYAVDLASAVAAVDPPRVGGIGAPVSRTVTGTATDSMSGVSRVEVRFTPSNGGAALPLVDATCGSCGAGARSVTWQVAAASLPRGSYVVDARAYDVAGHPAEWSTGVSMVIVG